MHFTMRCIKHKRVQEKLQVAPLPRTERADAAEEEGHRTSEDWPSSTASAA